MVAVAILPYACFMRAQRSALVLSFLYGKERLIENLRLPIGPFAILYLLIHERFGNDDLIKEIPTAVVRQRSRTFIKNLPHRIEVTLRSTSSRNLRALRTSLQE